MTYRRVLTTGRYASSSESLQLVKTPGSRPASSWNATRTIPRMLYGIQDENVGCSRAGLSATVRAGP